MLRRKIIERDFPHTVETVVPSLRSKRNAMLDFHARRGIKPYPWQRYKDGQGYICSGFADREIAEAFAAKFARDKCPAELLWRTSVDFNEERPGDGDGLALFNRVTLGGVGVSRGR